MRGAVEEGEEVGHDRGEAQRNDRTHVGAVERRGSRREAKHLHVIMLAEMLDHALDEVFHRLDLVSSPRAGDERLLSMDRLSERAGGRSKEFSASPKVPDVVP